ncbi:glycosyltransferase family 2 protein [Eudoraea chungangensis]|uniref:glycosyltransferase family 2 protein n=1 Tax=Eudoraea chungangensis TaxID=1481905 RepID=UPI0023EC7B53|nr:glycosyltransferase family 2 protein [Eudoraea chungangensis]
MRYFIVICAHNEEEFLEQTLKSVLDQSILPQQAVVVNDNSVDNTEGIIDLFATESAVIHKINHNSTELHMPGSKVIDAFYAGLSVIPKEYDFIVKLDADIILPENYFEKIIELIRSNPKAGILGGFAYEADNHGSWVLNHPMNKDHVRGAFKAYTKNCFTAIGGLKKAMGWDTVDELLARYHGFTVITDASLKIKHLRPLGSSYSKKARYLQGKAMYRMRYGFVLTALSSLKMAFARKKVALFMDSISGYFMASKDKTSFLVDSDEGAYIRKYRWNSIRNKLF